ncbi:MAG TPA: ABC transporter permease [Ruania sp.]|nr:ABC transporter permease [Ruania sp.]
MTGTDVDLVRLPALEPAPVEAGGVRVAGRGRLTRVRSWLRAPGALLSAVFLLLVICWAAVPSLFAPFDPVSDLDRAATLAGPSAEHWFGTDALGRDVYSRVVHGARLSMLAAGLAVSISVTAGAVLGVLAGYVGRWLDSVLMRTVDVLVAIPGLLLSMVVVSMLGFGVVNVAVAVGVAGIPGFARIVRAETLRILSRPYLDAARTSGLGHVAIMVRHVLPNASGAIAVLAALELGGAILAVSALSFLGFGAVPPTPEWGALVNDGRGYIASAWWLTSLPGAVIAATVIAINRLSREIGVVQR